MHARLHANAQTDTRRRIVVDSPEQLQRDLTAAVTRYDRAQARSRFHNPNALGIYLGRVDEIVAAYRRRRPLQPAIEAAFNDRLLDRVLIHLRDAGWPVAPVA